MLRASTIITAIIWSSETLQSLSVKTNLNIIRWWMTQQTAGFSIIEHLQEDYKGLCAKKHLLGSDRISPTKVLHELMTLWSKAGRTNHSAMQIFQFKYIKYKKIQVFGTISHKTSEL